MIVTYIFILFQLMLLLWFHLRYKLFQKQNLTGGKGIDQELLSLASCKVYIVIPCLREKDIIIGTIKYFISIIPNRSIFKLIIVTTQKEDTEKANGERLIPHLLRDLINSVSCDKLLERYSVVFSRIELMTLTRRAKEMSVEELTGYVWHMYRTAGTTYSVVQNFIEEKTLQEDVILFDYPKSKGFMAHQLNYVFSEVKKNATKMENTYFCVYNADSRPHQKTFLDVLSCIQRHNHPQVLQQYSALISNIELLSPIMKGFAIYQSNFEINNGYINAMFPSKYLRNCILRRRTAAGAVTNGRRAV